MESSKMSEPSTSSDSSLLYSEYVNTDPIERVINVVDKKKEKPVIKFTKSLVLARAIGLLSAFKESEKELKKKSEKERNIENCEEGAPVIEMNVAVLKEESADSESVTAVENADTSSDSDDSDCEANDLDHDSNVPECFSGIFERHSSDSKVFKLLTADPNISELSNSPLKEKVSKLPQDLKCGKITVETAITNSELDQPPAKKICV